MDLATEPLDQVQRAGSSEPSSTRPNPFDDSEAARKRRRTSTSASSPRSASVSHPSSGNSSSTATLNGDAEAPHTSLFLDKPPAEMQPDELNSSLEDPMSGPSSNIIALNLRNGPRESSNSQSISLPPSPQERLVQDDHNAHVQAPDAEIAPAPNSPEATGSSLLSESPPIELIEIPDDDSCDDNDLEMPIVGDLSTTNQLPCIDPMDKFPYHDAGNESRCETIQRLAQYISTVNVLDESILFDSQAWLESYLRFLKQLDPERIEATIKRYKEFWLLYPEIIIAIAHRRPPLHRDTILRNTILQLYADFGQMAAYLVTLDISTLTRYQTQSPLGESSSFELLSGQYLHSIHILTERPICSLEEEGQENEDDDYGSDEREAFPRAKTTQSDSDDTTMLVNKLEMCFGGTLDRLEEFADLLLSVVLKFPQFASTVASATLMLSDLMREAHRAMILEPDKPGQQNASCLERGHSLSIRISTCLNELIDQHVTHLGNDTVSCMTIALAHTIKICLRSHHTLAKDATEKFKELYPDIPSVSIPDVLAMDWRLDILGKLIRCSQMQLRVMATASMCSDLLMVWRRFKDEAPNPFLTHTSQQLVESSLVDYILGPSCHPEIIIESANIVGFLIVTKAYRREHTDRLWQTITTSQDPRISEALVKMTTIIANLFGVSDLLDLCATMQTLPLEGFVPMIRVFCKTVLEQLLCKVQNSGLTLSYQPYDLCLRLLRESSVCTQGSQIAHPEMQQLIKEKFRELLKFGPNSEDRAELYEACLGDIAQKASTSLGSLWCLSITIQPFLKQEIRTLTEDRDLARLLVEELQSATHIGETIGVPAVLHGHTNQPRREFIGCLIRLQPNALLDECIAKVLWDYLVGPCSPCAEDREAGWRILNNIVESSDCGNAFIRLCLEEYLPTIEPLCFCKGMLDFIRNEVLSIANVPRDNSIDGDEQATASCREQLWRIILTANDATLANFAIQILTDDLYMSRTFLSKCSTQSIRRVHSGLVTRCFSQLKEATSKGAVMVDTQDEPMVEGCEPQANEQQRIFIRSLQSLQYFHEMYQRNNILSAPDVWTMVCPGPFEIKGDCAGLKYQAFDDMKTGGIESLDIGNLNTVGSLLSKISEVTEFQNFKIFYRGKRFIPHKTQICKTLDELHLRDCLIIVKRDEKSNGDTNRVKPGTSYLEMEVLSHFEEMWNYLSMEECLARKIHDFLTKLPVHSSMIESFVDEKVLYTEIFPSKYPFRALYAVHALSEYKQLACCTNESEIVLNSKIFFQPSKETARNRSVSLILQALSDSEIGSHHSVEVQMQLTNSLMKLLLKWLQNTDGSKHGMADSGYGAASPDTFVRLLSSSMSLSNKTGWDLASHTFRAMLWLGILDVEFWNTLIADEAFSQVLKRLLLGKEKSMREMTATVIQEFIHREEKMECEDPHRMTRFFWSAVSNLIPDAASSPDSCHEVFVMLDSLLIHGYTKWRDEMDISTLAIQLSGLLMSHESTEAIEQIDPQDPVAYGLSSLLLLCLRADKTLCTSGALPKHLAPQLFWRHLFPSSEKVNTAVPRVIINYTTRNLLCKIIFKLSVNDQLRFRRLLECVDSLVPYCISEEDEAYIYDTPYGFERHRIMRAPCGYMGLRNLSNTCYLNSLLTQLFMNTKFRSFIFSCRIRDENTQQLLCNTKKLFSFMQESYLRFTDPTDLIASIKTYEDTPIDVHNQMDVDEFYNLIFDRWEGQVSGAVERKDLRSFYGGQLVQQVKSMECEHISERLEPFSAIQCDIKGKRNLQESLQAYVDGEVLDGDNKYKCSTCDRHVDAVKRACLKDISDNVIFHLKRFDFNLRTLQRSKINDHFAFPRSLDLNPYTVEYLSDNGESKPDVFELVGVLVHAGTAESGHYYSYIRERPSNPERPTWYEFNDENVSPWDQSQMQAATFGGSTCPSEGAVYEKPYSAYMLFYQRASSLNFQQEMTMEQNSPVPLRVDLDAQQKQHICMENAQLLRRHCLFDPSHIRLVEKCFDYVKGLDGVEITPPETATTGTATNDDEAGDAEMTGKPEGSVHSDGSNSVKTSAFAQQDIRGPVMATVLSHFDQVIARAKGVPDQERWESKIADAISESPRFAFVFYDYFNKRPNALRSLLLRNPDHTIRKFTGECLISSLRIIRKAMPLVYDPAQIIDLENEEPSGPSQGNLQPSLDDSVLEGALCLLNRMWRGFFVHLRAWDELFGTICNFAKLGDVETRLLLADDYLQRLCRMLLGDGPIAQPAIYTRMAQNIARRLNGQSPSYAWVMELIAYLLRQLEPDLGPGTIIEFATERLEQQRAPFPWTSEEIYIITCSEAGSSFFIERLIEIDQAPSATVDIIHWLMRTNYKMDATVCKTIQGKLDQDTPSNVVKAALLMGARYLEHTKHTQHARELATHVAIQARRMQIMDNPHVISFFKAGLSMEDPEDVVVAEEIQDICLSLIPEWIHCLLLHPLSAVRASALNLVGSQVSAFGPEWEFEEGLFPEDKKQLILLTARRVAITCLEVLRDMSDRRRLNLSAQQAMCLVDAASLCGTAFSTELGADDEMILQYSELQRTVMEQVGQAITEDVDEASDWEAGSCGSSEEMDLSDSNLQRMDDFDENDINW